MSVDYAWNIHDQNSLAYHYRDKYIINGFSTKTSIGYKGWGHVVVLYDEATGQYLSVKTRGGINEVPWHENTIVYGAVAHDAHSVIEALHQLVQSDPYHYDPVQVVTCVQDIVTHFSSRHGQRD